MSELNNVNQRFYTLEEIKDAAINARLTCFNGNRIRTAKSLKIGARTLQRWLVKQRISAIEKDVDKSTDCVGF